MMEKVNVIFKSGKTGTIYKVEYEANKNSGFIVGLAEENTQQKELDAVPENKELKKTRKTK